MKVSCGGGGGREPFPTDVPSPPRRPRPPHPGVRRATPGPGGTAPHHQPLTPGAPGPRRAPARPPPGRLDPAARAEAARRRHNNGERSGPPAPGPAPQPSPGRPANGGSAGRAAPGALADKGRPGPGLAAVSQRRRDKAGPRRLGASILAPRPPLPPPAPRPRPGPTWSGSAGDTGPSDGGRAAVGRGGGGMAADCEAAARLLARSLPPSLPARSSLARRSLAGASEPVSRRSPLASLSRAAPRPPPAAAPASSGLLPPPPPPAAAPPPAQRPLPRLPGSPAPSRGPEGLGAGEGRARSRAAGGGEVRGGAGAGKELPEGESVPGDRGSERGGRVPGSEEGSGARRGRGLGEPGASGPEVGLWNGGAGAGEGARARLSALPPSELQRPRADPEPGFLSPNTCAIDARNGSRSGTLFIQSKAVAQRRYFTPFSSRGK